MTNHLTRLLLLMLLTGGGLIQAFAQELRPSLSAQPGDGQSVQNSPEEDERQRQRIQRQQELAAIEEAARENAERREALLREISEIKSDRGKLDQSLIETAGRLKAFESKLDSSERRLETLAVTQDALKRSLNARRAVIGEVLAALQRMGRKPPPAILVEPREMLDAVRAALAMGGVLPELRVQVDVIVADLQDLTRLRDEIATEQDRTKRDMAELARERTRLTALIDARRDRLSESEKIVAQELKRAGDLAREAKTMRELLHKLESEIAASEKAAAENRSSSDRESREVRDKVAALSGRDPARLQTQTPFAQLRGALNLPVSGRILRQFGDPDPAGGQARGQAIETRPGSIVTAPADGTVAFAGPFRSFGQLLIVNAGGGYYILMAGMSRLDVGVGQFVLAGEPVAAMGPSDQAKAKTQGLVFYVEFRKDGQSIDPAPWWARADNEKARG